MEKKRERYLDISKGVAILCIVLLHIEDGVFPASMNVYIGQFMISMFFITTGWLDGYRSTPLPLRVLITKRWQQLGMPYIWWSGIILTFDLLLLVVGYYDTYLIGRDIYKTLVLRGIGTLWFLPALFGGEIIWNTIRNSRFQVIFGLVAVFLTMAVLQCYYRVFSDTGDDIMKIIEAPIHTIRNILISWPSIAGGFLLRFIYIRLKLDKLKKWNYLIIGILISAIAYWSANYWPISALRGLITPILCPTGILFLSMACEKLRIMNYFTYWGQNSLALMVTHYSILMPLCNIINKTLIGTYFIQGYPAFVYFIAVMIIEYYLCEYITKRFPLTLGKIR